MCNCFFLPASHSFAVYAVPASRQLSLAAGAHAHAHAAHAASQSLASWSASGEFKTVYEGEFLESGFECKGLVEAGYALRVRACNSAGVGDWSEQLIVNRAVRGNFALLDYIRLFIHPLLFACSRPLFADYKFSDTGDTNGLIYHLGCKLSPSGVPVRCPLLVCSLNPNDCFASPEPQTWSNPAHTGQCVVTSSSQQVGRPALVLGRVGAECCTKDHPGSWFQVSVQSWTVVA